MYKYRYTVQDDINKIKEINEKYLKENYKYKFWFNIISKFNSYNFICFKDNVIVGYVLACPNIFENKDNEILLISIAVNEEDRNNGIAKNLINLLLKTCKINKTLNRCILNVRENTNKNGINLYSKLGFSLDKIIEKYYQDGENCILMEYKLK
jgi:ribosomal protein S18 acetylase RimI-like enzyme